MALNQNSIAFLFYCRKAGVSFEKTLMFGRQELYCAPGKIVELASAVDYTQSIPENINLSGKYSEPLFSVLGAAKTDSMDFSDYENATIIHDLNNPVPWELKGKFTAVVDAGTLEHIFNFPAAIKNAMELLAENGHFISITPANNHLGHGFYQFSPELFFSVFNTANGFGVIKILVVADNADGSLTDWYEVTDPGVAGERVSLSNSRQLTMLVLAKKIKEQSVFVKWPQQSDYINAWATSESLKKGIKPENVSKIKFLYRRWMPVYIKNFIGNFLNLFRKTSTVNEDLGHINPKHFKKLNLK